MGSEMCIRDRIDTVSKERRSEIMSRIRSKGMKPEMIVRRMTHAMGYRYRLHYKTLPGTPDLVFPGRRKAIFVHGCFWHQHSDPACKKARVPESNRDFWVAKFERNMVRDAESQSSLVEMGWDVLVIWECEIEREGEALAGRIDEFLSGPASES